MHGIHSILTVCVGNICRSPTAEFLLQHALPDLKISSAGIAALVGQDMEPTARAVAEENGVICPQHVARQLTPALCREADLILVMEAGLREAVTAMCPEVRGKTFLLAQGLQPANIVDPYRKGREAFDSAFRQIEVACAMWIERLSPKRPVKKVG